MADLLVIVAFILVFATLCLHLSPRWHRKRTLTIPLLNFELSHFKLRQTGTRILLILVYFALFIVTMREIYITSVRCETSESLHHVSIALQSRVLRQLDKANVPVWAEGETLIDYLYTTSPLPRWKSSQSFSTLWTSVEGLKHIEKILTIDTGLVTTFYPRTKLLKIWFKATRRVGLELLFWDDILDIKTNNRFLKRIGYDGSGGGSGGSNGSNGSESNDIDPYFDLTPTTSSATRSSSIQLPSSSPSTLSASSSSLSMLPTILHFYEVFPLHFRPPMGYPAAALGLQSRSENNTINNNNNNNNDKEQFTMVGIPNLSHQIALRMTSTELGLNHNSIDTQQSNSSGSGSTSSSSSSTPTRDQCSANILKLRFLPLMYYDSIIREELELIGLANWASSSSNAGG